MSRIFRWTALLLTVVLMTAALAGCGAGQADQGGKAHAVVMADMGKMPHMVQAAPRVVANAYRFAAANPDALQHIPCYCGCGGMGHMSNYNCFWQDSGQVDTHGLGCGICVDIAQDVQRGLERGRSLAEIRAQIDADYGRYGPPTDTEPVTAGVY